MGRNLTDHPAYFYDRWHDLPNSGGLSWLGDVQGHAKVLLRSTNPHDEPYNIELLINASYWDSRFADHDLWNRSIARDAKVEIKFIFDSPLDPENYIETKGEGRKPWIRVKPNHHGQQYREKIVQARNTILKSLGIPDEELSSAWDDEEWRPGYNGSVQHAGGSMRMSDDGTGAVDENLRLLGYENIHCCDPSVFPSIPAANPSLTVVALALRLAKHLDSQLRA
jgi:choline dehydrogenase-like flavoprotein